MRLPQLESKEWRVKTVPGKRRTGDAVDGVMVDVLDELRAANVSRISFTTMK